MFTNLKPGQELPLALTSSGTIAKCPAWKEASSPSFQGHPLGRSDNADGGLCLNRCCRKAPVSRRAQGPGRPSRGGSHTVKEGAASRIGFNIGIL